MQDVFIFIYSFCIEIVVVYLQLVPYALLFSIQKVY